MTTRSGRQYIPSSSTMTSTNPVTPVNSPKWSHEELFGPLGLTNTQGGLHDLPKKVESWIPKFSGENGSYGDSHWTKFCEEFHFHQSGQEHPDVFLRLFVSSLTGSARRWINKLPKGSIKTPEDLEQVFKKDWCEKESMDSLYSQYTDICKASSEGIRDFNDRFNLLLKKIRPSFSEEAILQHYLNSLEGVLQFTLKDRSPSTLEEAQDFAYQIERNLEFEDYIHQVNLSHNNNPWESSDEDITETEPKLPEILEVKLMPPKRKWSTTFSNVNDVLNFSRQHEPSEGLGMATHKKPNFEDSLFVLNTQMLENQDMSETNRDPKNRSEEPRVHSGTNLSTSMSCILQRVKRIREMLKTSFLTKQDSDNQLSFEGIPTLLQTGHVEQDEQTPSSLLTDDLGPSDYNSVDPYLFQDCPTFPLTEEDTNWGDYPDDTSDVSEDWDEDGYPVQRIGGFVEWNENVFKDIEVPNTLKPTNIVDENPWCFQCSEAHWEHECPYSDSGHQQVNNIGHVIEGPQINITAEEHQEAIKEAARKARMAVINNLDQESKEKLKKQEFQVYRRKKLSQPTAEQTKPPSLDVLLPKTSKTERVDLNFDFEGALSKMHVTIPLREVIKVPSVKERFDNFFQGSDGPMDPPIMLQADHFRVQYGENPPFFMTLVMNNKSLNNCMLDTGAGANIMSFKVMQQLGLKVTRPYRNVCGFESKAIPTHGVIENVKVCLKEYPEKVIHVDIVVVDIPDVWGMLLSRKFASELGGTLEMDLTYVNIPLKDGTIGRLQNVPVTTTHVQEPSESIKDDKTHDETRQTLHEYSNQIKWPKKEEYQQLLDELKMLSPTFRDN
jgi:hypothetical protein